MSAWNSSTAARVALAAIAALGALCGCVGPLRGGHRVPEISSEQIGHFANAERQLRSVDSQVREKAAVAMLSMDHPRARLAVLERLRKDRDPAVRVSMIRAVAFCVDHECFDALLDAVKDPDESAKEAAASALGWFSRPEEVKAIQSLASASATSTLERQLLFRALGDGLFVQAAPVLLEGLRSRNEDTRYAAWQALRKISGRELPPEPDAWAGWWAANRHNRREDILERRVRELTLTTEVINERNKDLKEQFEELSALVRRPDSEAPEFLFKALSNRHPGIRDYAAFRLASMEASALTGISLDDEGTYGLLRRRLADQTPDVRESIVRLVVLLKGRYREKLLLAALEDKNPRVLVRAIEAVNGGMDEAAVGRLEAALDSPHDEVREAAANALGKLGAKEAVPALLAALQDRDEDVRWFAVEGLRKLNATEAVPRLCERLERDGSARVREIAASALGELGQPAAIPSLRKALTHSNDRVRARAVTALQALARDDLERMMVIASALSVSGFSAEARDVLRKAIEEFDGRPGLEDELVAARKELAELLKEEEDFAAAAGLYEELDRLTGGDHGVRQQLIQCRLAAGEAGRVVPAMAQWVHNAKGEELADIVELGCETARKLVGRQRDDLAAELAQVLLKAARRSKDQRLIKKVQNLGLGPPGTGD